MARTWEQLPFFQTPLFSHSLAALFDGLSRLQKGGIEKHTPASIRCDATLIVASLVAMTSSAVLPSAQRIALSRSSDKDRDVSGGSPSGPHAFFKWATFNTSSGSSLKWGCSDSTGPQLSGTGGMRSRNRAMTLHTFFLI